MAPSCPPVMALTFVPASAVETTRVAFTRLPVEMPDRTRIGELAGLVIDLARQRLRYFVVESSPLSGPTRRLVPFTAATIDRARGALRLEATAPDSCAEFDPRAFRALSTDDTTVFAR